MRRKHGLGLFYIGLVVVLWVSSGYMVGEIFLTARSPFLVTYYSTALFTIYLLFYIPLLCSELRHRNGVSECQRFTPGLRTCSYAPLVGDGAADPDSVNVEPQSSGRALGPATVWWCFVVRLDPLKLPLGQTFRLSAIFCFIWFLMTYLYNSSLAFTSLGSNTVLSTLSGPFCLILSRLLLKDPLVFSNVLGVLVVFGGAVLIGMQDEHKEKSSSDKTILGDILAIASAFVYGLYTTLLKKMAGDDENLSTMLFFGMLGGINILTLWPIGFILHWLKVEEFHFPDWHIVGLLTLTGAINVASDYFWARSILPISPVVATVGISLTIPLALVVDELFRGKHYSTVYIVGAVAVVIGFLLVNWKGLSEEDDSETPAHLPLPVDAELRLGVQTTSSQTVPGPKT